MAFNDRETGVSPNGNGDQRQDLRQAARGCLFQGQVSRDEIMLMIVIRRVAWNSIVFMLVTMGGTFMTTVCDAKRRFYKTDISRAIATKTQWQPKYLRHKQHQRGCGGFEFVTRASHEHDKRRTDLA
jgi:hypothetical protein